MNKKEAAAIAAAFESSLASQAKPGRAEFEKKYLKSDLRFLGATMPVVRAECKGFYRENRLISRADLDVLTDVLWQTRCHELRSIGICLMVHFSQLYSHRDLPMVKQLVTEAGGWAHVDWLATDLLGSIYTRSSSIAAKLRSWSKHEDFWVRRASMLALLDEARHGNRAAFDLFAEFAATMIEEKEFFIRKAIGWILREASKKQPQWTFDFLMKHRQKASGLTMREGSKYLTPEMQAKLKQI
ncbi:MAG: DNA alkylation repair protein [Fimbriimonadales bacterium]